MIKECITKEIHICNDCGGLGWIKARVDYEVYNTKDFETSNIDIIKCQKCNGSGRIILENINRSYAFSIEEYEKRN